MANPTLLSVPLCRDAEKNTIPVTDNGTTGKFSEQYGWQGINSLPLSAGGKAVERLDFNGVLALLGGIDYMTQRGYTFEYDNSLPYVAGCIVVDPLDGKTYRCINDVPIGASNPSNDAINWVSYDIADYVGGALRSKAYNVGDTSTLVGIPAGYFLECTTAGTSGATAPVITPPVTEGTTITDGTVVWTVRACASKAFVAGHYLPLAGGGQLTGQSLKWNGADLGGSAITAKSIGLSGYIKRYDGMLTEWGVSVLPFGAEGSAVTTETPFELTITLPLSVSNIPCVVASVSSNYATGKLSIESIYTPDGTHFTVRGKIYFLGSTNRAWVQWHAIGKE